MKDPTREKYIKGVNKLIIGDKTLMKLYPQAFNIAKGVNFNTKNFKLSQSLFRELATRTEFGTSKKLEKEKAIQEHKDLCNKEGKAFNLTDVRLPGIYSHSTFRNYLQVGGRFLEYLDREGLTAKNIMSAVERYGVDYLKDMEDRELSPYTVLQAKAFMGKVLDREMDYKIKSEKDPTKGRSESVRTRTFREDLNKDLVTIAKGTGGRRGDLEKLTTRDFVKRGDVCVGVEFRGSKGGRDRYAPILPKYQKEITKIVIDRELQAKDRLFDTINNHANIHSYRRLYCQELYRECVNDKRYRDDLIKLYKSREKEMSGRNKEDYNTRDGRSFDRQSLFVASQALGHNRLDVIPRNYFK